MSDTARPKSAGDGISKDEINADFPIVLTGGETLSGDTTPVPVYIDTDGELYACDANDTDKLAFIGFVIDDTTDGNDATFQKDGVVGGFSSLTVGSMYYVQDTAGTIGTSPGTYEVPVGRAVSSTQILIDRNAPRFYVTTGYNSGQSISASSYYDITVTCGFRPKMIQMHGLLGTTNVAAGFSAGGQNVAGIDWPDTGVNMYFPAYWVNGVYHGLEMDESDMNNVDARTDCLLACNDNDSQSDFKMTVVGVTDTGFTLRITETSGNAGTAIWAYKMAVHG